MSEMNASYIATFSQITGMGAERKRPTHCADVPKLQKTRARRRARYGQNDRRRAGPGVVRERRRARQALGAQASRLATDVGIQATKAAAQALNKRVYFAAAQPVFRRVQCDAFH